MTLPGDYALTQNGALVKNITNALFYSRLNTNVLGVL